ncbi:hypothetical protein SDC9_114992 [bioreactor metagenome]|uniref:Uncharacterized protein n=1 Tax=bioreactor metagenome TaxID=1076179 RepID=A0A645BRS6_9ZZZZ
MSQIEKLLLRLISSPKDFTFEELTKVFVYLGFELSNKGKTSGSRIRFYHKEKKLQYLAHKPHPKNIIKEKALKDITHFLMENNLLK